MSTNSDKNQVENRVSNRVSKIFKEQSAEQVRRQLAEQAPIPDWDSLVEDQVREQFVDQAKDIAP